MNSHGHEYHSHHNHENTDMSQSDKMHNEHSQHNHHDHHAHMVADFKKRFWISLIITIPVLVLSPMIRKFLGIQQTAFNGSIYFLFVLSSGIFFYGGYPFLKGLFDELKSKSPGMMTLIALAISVAYLYSSAVVFGLTGRLFYWELATLIDIMLLGHWIEMESIMGASKALEELAKLMPKSAHKIFNDGNIEDVTLDKIKSGDTLLIKPGEKVPADGEIIEGQSEINESMVTGESKPVSKKIGDEVIGGSINGEGSLKVEVKKTGNESFLSQVISMVKTAQESKSKTQNLANKAALWLTIIALASGIITMIVWLIIGKDFNFALTRAVTVMVITCPHALGLAIPLVVAVSTALSAKKGLLIKNRNGFERARNIQAVVFDKTGTLTKGEFGVTDVLTFDHELGKDELIKYAASIEVNSEHPIARGIVKSIDKTFNVENFISIPGKGAEGNVNGKNIKVVSPGYLEEKDIKIPDPEMEVDKGKLNAKEKIEKLSGEGKTVVFVLVNERLAGAIALADIIREESKEAVAKLKGLGVKTMMLTGDNEKVAKWVADELGLDDYFAQVLPGNKVDKIKEIQKDGTIVAMTGDGVNDAPALAQADVGIAIGAGTDVAVETADIVLVKSNPQDVVSLVNFSKATYKKMIQNLIWSTGYNVIAIPLAAGILYSFGILLSPAVGAVLMSLSTVIVSINARLLKV